MCYKFNGYMFRSPLRPSSDQLLQIVRLNFSENGTVKEFMKVDF